MPHTIEYKHRATTEREIKALALAGSQTRNLSSIA